MLYFLLSVGILTDKDTKEMMDALPDKQNLHFKKENPVFEQSNLNQLLTDIGDWCSKQYGGTIQIDYDFAMPASLSRFPICTECLRSIVGLLIELLVASCEERRITMAYRLSFNENTGAKKISVHISSRVVSDNIFIQFPTIASFLAVSFSKDDELMQNMLRDIIEEIKKYGWMLDWEQGVNHELRFIVTVPVLNEGLPILKSNDAVHSATSIGGLTGKHFLIAEDDELNFKYLQALLSPLHPTVEWVKNGSDAVEYCTKKAPDIVLMDMRMPVKNGLDATKEIRQLGNNVPIIAQTANAMSGDRVKCLAAGCNDYIAKPIQREQFFDLLKLHLHL